MLTVTETNLMCVCELISEMKYLIKLDASSNRIVTLDQGCFKCARNISVLNLANNSISSLEQGTFSNISKLKVLNFTQNPLALDKHFLSSPCQIFTLSIKENNITEIDNEVFEGTDVQYLETDNYHLCFMFPGSNCTAKSLWYLLHLDLLPNTGIQVTFYCASFVIVIANIVSIVVHKVSHAKGLEKTGAYGLTIASINISDEICTIPLFILWATYLQYKGYFIILEAEWRSGFLCFTSFAVMLQFCFLSPLLLCFLSVSRLMLVVHPMDTCFKETRFVRRSVAAIFTVCSLIASLIATTTWVIYSSVPSALCSPIYDPTDNVIVVLVLVWIIAISQAIYTIVIIGVYINMVRSFTKSQQNIQQAVSKKQSNIPMILQVLVLTSSNVLCWISGGVISLACFFIKPHPIELIFWTTAAVSPLNSLTNPTIFIFTAIRKILKA